jgi:peptide/nickel transport system permease protein
VGVNFALPNVGASVFSFIAKRMVATIPVMGVVALFVFLMLRLSPGDPASVIAGDYATPEDIERIRAQLGLSDPIVVQFGNWIWKLVHADLGISIFSNLPVTTLIVQRLEPTAMLSLTTLFFSVAVAVPLGVLAAWKAGTWIDRAIMIFAVAGFSIPVFVLGYMFIYEFAMVLKWLPVQGYRSPFEGLWPFLRHIILPTLTLSVIFIALFARITRASVLEVLEEDYIRTARAKGQVESKVLISHALRNAAVPIVTVIGLGIALLIGGVVVTESVYNIPGLGRLVLDAILKRDYPIIQGLILMFSFVYIIINLMIDIVYTVIDPRIRY